MAAFCHVCNVLSGFVMLKNHPGIFAGLLPPGSEGVDNSVQQ
jgi:hypothetical protein